MEKKNSNVVEWVYEIAVSDSQKAFQSLYMHYFDRLLRFGSLHNISHFEAEEIVSDTFLAVWNNRKSLLDISSFDAYIYSIMRYKIITHLRSNTYNNVSLDDLQVDFFYSTESTPEEDYITREQVEMLNKAINTLPHKCKMAFKLVREDKMKYKDVAAILEISVKTLETHLATATRKLRETLSKIERRNLKKCEH